MSKILIEEINRNRKVMGVKPLNESQEIDLILEDINKELLNEGWWETTKYALSKLGRYKADGKILGKTQATANAEGKIRDLLTKKGNEIIQQLDRDIREIDSEFPNNKSRVSFLRCIILVSQAYDSIVASTKLSPTDPKFLPIDAANVIIGDLRTYVKKFLDTDLTAAFSVMDHENIEGNLITEDELLYEAEPRSTKLNQAGKTGTFDSSRMKTLKSNRLPLLLAGAGVSLGGLSWLMGSVWGQRLIEVPTEGEKIKYLKNTIGIIQPGQGLTQWLNMFEGTGLNPNSTPQQFLDAVTKVGNGDLDKGIGALTEQGGIFRNPDAAKQVLEQIKNNPDGYKSLGEMFKGTWAGTGRSIGDTLVTVPGGSVVEIIAKKVTVPILKKILVTTAAGSASPIVGALGIGLIAAGALVKGMRIKGQKQSRAKTLNDLYQSLVDLKPTQENPSSGIIKTDGEGGDKQNQQGGTTGVNIECVKNLMKATIQLNEMINKGVVKNPTNKNDTSSKGNIKVGQEYLYNNKPVLVLNLKNPVSKGSDKKWLTKDDIIGKDTLGNNMVSVVFKNKLNDYSDMNASTAVDISKLKPMTGGNKPQPTQQKQGRFPNSKPLTQSQLKSSIDSVVHNILREFIELQEAGAAWNTANAANVTQTNAPKGGALQAGETDAVNSWNKVVKAFKQANVSVLVKPMELLVNTSISQGKDTLKAANEDISQIGNLIIQNRATIGKVIPFEQLVKEAEDPKIARSRNVQAISKAISLVSRIIMAYKEDIGLTGAYGSAKAPMNLFIQAYDCVIKGGGKSGGQTTQGGNNQANQGTQGTNQQGSNQANQVGGNQPEGNEQGGTEQSVSQETSNKKPTGDGFDTKVSGSIRGDYFR
jgi:hypothetical protein